MVEAGDKCGAGPPRCKWPFSQPRRQLLSATHSHLVPLLFSSTNHFILAGSLPSVQCWQAPVDSNVMQAEHFNPVPPSSSRNFVQTQMIDCFWSVWETGGSQSISLQQVFFWGGGVQGTDIQCISDNISVCCWCYTLVTLTSRICRWGSSQRSKSGPSLRPRFQTCQRRTTAGSQLISRSTLSTGECNTVRCRCPLPQPQLDGDTSHMLE